MTSRRNIFLLGESFTIAQTTAAAAIVLGGWYRESRQKDLTSVERQLILDLAECPVFVIKDNVHADGFC